MTLQIKQNVAYGIGLCLFLACGVTGVAQHAPESRPKLFIRYENRAGINRLGESVLTLTLSVSPNDRAKVAIRVCSKEPLAFALPTASASPLEIADALINKFAYPENDVVYLRSKDCLSAQTPAIPITEIWTIPPSSPLPPHDEAALASQVKVRSLGKITARPGVRDYKLATLKLINELTTRPNSVGIVLGYFYVRPSPVLQRRLRETTRTLARSGLPSDRYRVSLKPWDDESSETDREPVYPSVLVVQVDK